MNTLREYILLDNGSGRSRFTKEQPVVKVDLGGLSRLVITVAK